MFRAPYFIEFITSDNKVIETVEVQLITEAANYWQNCNLKMRVRDSLYVPVPEEILETLDGRLN